MSQFKYTVIEGNDDPLKVKIRKENITAEFTLGEIEADRKAAEKIRAQIVTQIQLDGAQVQNIVNHHPYVVEASEEERKKAVAIALYNGLLNKVKESQAKLAEIDQVFEENTIEMADIKEQTGIEVGVESPYVETKTN